MTSRRGPLPLVAAAVAILGAVAWFALAPGAVRRSADEAAGTEERGDGRREGGRDVTAAAGGSPSGAGGTVPPEEADPAPPASAADGEIALREALAVLDGGWPLAGVEVRSYGPDGAHLWVALSDVEGRVPFAEAAALLRVDHPYADAVAVEGGALEPAEGAGRRRDVRPGPGPLRLVFRDRADYAFVRLKNAVTGDPVIDLSGVRIEWRLPDGRRLRSDLREDTGQGGWIPVVVRREDLLPGIDPPPDPAEVKVEFSAPGFERRTVPMTDLRGRVELPLDPAPPDVTGTVQAAAGLEDAEIHAEIRSLDEGPSAAGAGEVRGLPTREGRFAIHDLPPGRWELEVRAEEAGLVTRATRRFEHWSGTTDLGALVLRIGAALRARVLDASGRPIPQADVVVVREEEDPARARRLEPDRDGWVVYGDLEPGVRHRVAVLGLPIPMEEIRETPGRAGASADVEFRWEGSVVPCTFRFTLEGRPLGRPTALKEAPVRGPRQRWSVDGALEIALLPGRHRFSVEVVYADGESAGLYAAEVDVPAGDSFEATLPLTPPEEDPE